MSLKFEADPERVEFEVEIVVKDGAAELFLVNQGSVLVAQGVGRLKVKLAPGHYTLRQRVGYEQSLHAIEVSQEPSLPIQFVFASIAFPSPLPLRGTTLCRNLGLGRYLVAKGKRSFQMLLWSPSSDALAHLEQVFAQLRLEHFQTGERVRLTVGRRAQAIVAYASLAPGPYQLVQLRKNGQRHCLPLWCVDGWVTSVYLLVLSDQVTAKPLPVELDHASMTLLRPGLRFKDVEGSLRRLEGARKALGLGRRISGWSTWQDSDSRVENPMLELMDALLSGSREIFCNNLSMPYCDGFSSASSEAGGGRTLGPPLLRQHWDLLLQSDGAERQLQALFHQPFTVEAKGVWFTWTELSHAAKFEDVSRFVLSQLAVQMAAEQVRAPRHTGPRFVKLKLRRLSGQSLEETIAAFFQSQTFKRAWAGSRKVAEGKRLHLTDPRLSKLFAALLVLTDQTLIQSIGAIELVRQALQGLRLPATQVNQLGWLLLQELLAWMGTESLAPVAVQPALPAAQLKLATKQVQQQKVALAPLLAAASKPFGDS